jgi:hypothetical protein
MSQLGLALPRPPAERISTDLGWHYPDLSDFRITLVVSGRPIVKKNHLTVYRAGKRMSMGPDGEYKRWLRRAWEELTRQWAAEFREPIPGDIEINLAVITYLENRRGWPDLSGTYEGPQDVLEGHRHTCNLEPGKQQCRRHAGVITNDRQICGHVGSDRRIDPNNPRLELVLTPHRRSP